VTLKMKAPSAHFLAVLADTSGMVVSPTAAQRHGEAFRENPVGTGPFVLKEWRRGSQIVFARNAAYWRGPVHLDEVVLRPMPDEQTRIASLKAGNLDVVMNAPAKDVIEARSAKKFTVLDPGSLGTVFVMINVAQPDVSDRRVRLAMAHALDRDALNKVVNRGLLKVANTPFGSGLAPHEQVEGFPKFDPGRAKALLADYGKPVRLKFTVTNMPQSLLAAQAIQAMWKKVGIEAEIEVIELAKYYELNHNRKLLGATLYTWGNSTGDPEMYTGYMLHPKLRFSAWKSDDMLEKLGPLFKETDYQKRIAGYKEVEVYAIQHGYTIPLLQAVATIVHQDALNYVPWQNAWIMPNYFSWK
jgi:peptide/nickel transport system substrate-binding protein